MNSEKNLKKEKQKKKPFYNFCYDFVKITGAIGVIPWLRPKIYRPYKEKAPKGAMLITANHRSFLDPITAHLAFPWRRLHCLATKDLYNTKLKAAFFNKMHCIMVDKENFTISAFHDVVSRLNNGCAVVIFPEGQLNRQKGDDMLTFKSGAVLMAYKANAPILPIYIIKREKWYHRQRIVVGKSFYVEGEKGKMPTMEQLNAASNELRNREIELHDYFESLPIARKIHKNHNKKEHESKEPVSNEQKV